MDDMSAWFENEAQHEPMPSAVIPVADELMDAKDEDAATITVTSAADLMNDVRYFLDTAAEAVYESVSEDPEAPAVTFAYEIDGDTYEAMVLTGAGFVVIMFLNLEDTIPPADQARIYGHVLRQNAHLTMATFALDENDRLTCYAVVPMLHGFDPDAFLTALRQVVDAIHDLFSPA